MTRRSSRPARDEPRSRGENFDLSPDGLHATGPAPLARGEPFTPTGQLALSRTSPARAGRTRTGLIQGYCQAGPARSRGEKGYMAILRNLRNGPAPLARGEPRRPRRRLPRTRTSPARAGRTTATARNARTATDQPRSRGENKRQGKTADGQYGPAPLARGEPCRAARPPTSTTDQPRSRGENPAQPDPERPGGRTSPARAGATTRAAEDSNLQTDQPRSRGRRHLAFGEACGDGRTSPARAGRTLRR